MPVYLFLVLLLAQWWYWDSMFIQDAMKMITRGNIKRFRNAIEFLLGQKVMNELFQIILIWKYINTRTNICTDGFPQ